MVTSLPSGTHARVAAAVTAAERTTDAEIVAVVAARSDAYHDAVLHWALLGMFLVLAIQAVVPGHFIPVLDLAFGGWTEYSLGFLLTALMVLLAFVFVVLRFALSPFGVALTPGRTKARRVRRRAVTLFRASIEARTATRTGVLLYLSLAERQAEIVTDSAILERVAPDAWGAAMAMLVDAIRDGRPDDGLVDAIGAIGAVLADVLPFTGTDPNELPDRLIEL